MRTMGRLTIIVAAILIMPLWVRGQANDCPQWPAPCPHSEEISQAMDAAGRMEGNTVTPQEIAMESNLRKTLTDILRKFTRPKHWEMYEIMESSYDRPNGTISFAQWQGTPYEKRPPHIYSISFIIVVNKDSLAAWRDWYNNVLPQQANQVVADIKTDGQNSQNDQVLQSLTDSVQYYAQLSAKYMQDHAAEYASDIQNNNQKGIKRYNDKVADYQKRSDALMQRLRNRANVYMSPSGDSSDRFANEKVSKTDQFINSSVVLVNFTMNAERAGFGLDGDDSRSTNPREKLNVPGAFYAGLLHNTDKPDGQSYNIGEHDYLFDHPENIATILFGRWQPKRDSYNNMPAAYKATKAGNDLTSVKVIKCDAVQNVIVQIEGRPDHIKNIVNLLDTEALQKLINP